MAPSGPVERERYARQSRFWAIGPTGQERLAASHVLVVGCGALGSASVNLLARAGVGRLTIVDRDFVELGNLQRQMLFDEVDAAAGTPKAIAAARAVARINSEVTVHPIVAELTPANAEELVSQADVVIDGTDNFEARYLINDACVKLGIPWIYGGALGSTGMSMTIVPGETACFRCVFPVPPPAGAMETTDTAGVLAAGTTTVAAIQSTEAMKLLVGDSANRSRGLTAFDVWTNDHLQAEGRLRDPDCACCGHRQFEDLEAGGTGQQAAALRGRGAIQVSPAAPGALDLAAVGRRLEPFGPVTVTEHLVRARVEGHEMTVFADGRAIVKGTSDVAVARALYARFVDV